MKDHEFREAVNRLRDVALQYRDADQLRERISTELRAVLAQEAGHVEEPAGMVVQCRYPRDSRYWEDGTPDELGLGTEYYEVRTLYTSPPAPVSVDAAKAFAKGFNTLESGEGKYRIVMQFAGRDDAWAAYKALSHMTSALDKVKELNQ